MLNTEAVKRLFEAEAVSFGRCDGVPLRRVAEIFGKDAADYGDHSDPDRLLNTFCAGAHRVNYMTFAGFNQAAAYYNAVEIAKRQEREDAGNV